MSKVIDKLNENKKLIIIILLAIACLLVYHFNKEKLKTKTTYTVINGAIESSIETNMYVLKQETMVEYDNSLSITAVIEQGKRVSKREIIATYKSDVYDDYLSQIEDIDKQIQVLVKDLPITYSADINSIENQIAKYAKESRETTSYIKMQEYKSKIDELSNKKVSILANTSPDSSAIRALIDQRNILSNKSKESSSTIKAPCVGVVSYKLDGAEKIYNYNSLLNMSSEEFNQVISTYENVISDDFGIKIINNYEVYLLIKSSKSDNDQYIKEGSRYYIRIANIDNKTIRPYLVKNIETSDHNYSLFKLENGLDNIIDYRILSVEIIWNTVNGMAVPCNAVKEDIEKGYLYVTMVYGADYVKVPIEIVASSDSIYIVKNVDKEKLKQSGIDSRFGLELYDELVLE